MWGRDLTHFSRAPPLRLGHRRLLLPQVDRHPGVGREVLQPGGRPFRAGLGDRGPTRAGHPERLDLTADDSARPILLVVSDDVPQMASEATRKFVTLMAVAQPPTRRRTRRGWETLFGHVKGEWSNRDAVTDPAVLEAERASGALGLQLGAPARGNRPRQPRRRGRGPSSGHPLGLPARRWSQPARNGPPAIAGLPPTRRALDVVDCSAISAG